jgi:hypothetical protein
MRKRIAVISLLLFVLVGFGLIFNQVREVKAQVVSAHNYAYLSGVVFAQSAETFTINSWNAGPNNQTSTVNIWRCTGFPCATNLVYSGTFTPIPPGTRAVFQYTVPGGITDYFAVEITTSSPDVVPQMEIDPPTCCSIPRFTLNGSQFIILKDQF